MTRIEQLEDLVEVDDASRSPDDTFEDLLKRAAGASTHSLSNATPRGRIGLASPGGSASAMRLGRRCGPK